MLQINFRPENDLEDLNKAVQEYQRIWVEDGEKIVSKWEEITGLKFNEIEIDATVANRRGMSHPLTLRCNLETGFKKSDLIHELGHILLYKKIKYLPENPSLERHKVLDLVLYDVLRELYGDEFIASIITRESEYPLYSEAWNWALQFKTKDERQNKFREALLQVK